MFLVLSIADSQITQNVDCTVCCGRRTTLLTNNNNHHSIIVFNNSLIHNLNNF